MNFPVALCIHDELQHQKDIVFTSKEYVIEKELINANGLLLVCACVCVCVCVCECVGGYGCGACVTSLNVV